MADKKISQLTSASQVNSDAVFPIVQAVSGSDETLKATVGQVGDYVSNDKNYLGLNTIAKNLIGAINEIAAGGGGGGVTPIFSETVLVDNSSLASSFTFSSDYHNYDFIRFKLYNSSSGAYTYILTTPSSIDAIFDITSYYALNEFHSNQYCDYRQNGLTWTRHGGRNVDVYEVVGLTCTNATVTETEIYKASTQSGTAVTVTTQENLMDFDWILFSNNDSSNDELLSSQTIFVPSRSVYIATGGAKQLFCCQSYNFYGFVDVEVWIDNHEISAHSFAYIVGIKFS